MSYDVRTILAGVVALLLLCVSHAFSQGPYDSVGTQPPAPVVNALGAWPPEDPAGIRMAQIGEGFQARPTEPAPIIGAGTDARPDPLFPSSANNTSFPNTTNPSPTNPNTTNLSPTNPNTASSTFASTTTASLISQVFGYFLPPMTSDFFSGGTRIVHIPDVQTFSSVVQGQILSGAPGSQNSTLGFGAGSGFDDFTTIGPGRDAAPDVAPDGFADTFDITEPIPPSDSPTSPGPSFRFQGGTVVYTGSDPTATTAQSGQYQNGETWYAEYSYVKEDVILIPEASVRRVKISENNSPIPRDRMYFDYRFFNDVIGGIGDQSRYTFGFEKTFCDASMSIDVRLPFAATLDSEQTIGGISGRGFEFGNATFIYKSIVYQDQTLLASIGSGVALPTAGSTRGVRTDGRQVVVIDNESVHLLPFVGAVWQPNNRYFMQGFLQLEMDLNGKPVRGNLQSSTLSQIGVLQDATLFFVDVGGGYWLSDARDESRLIARAALFGELHYSTSVQDADVVRLPELGGITVTDLTRRIDVLNATFGLHLDLGRGRTLTTAMSVPLRDGHDRQFDFEVAAMASWYF